MLQKMELAEVYQALGEERTARLVRTVSIGALKTFGVYKDVKVRSQLHTLNRQKLRAAASKLWQRIVAGDKDLATTVGQAVLVSNVPLIIESLDFLEIEHDGNGYFDKDADYSKRFAAGWERTLFDRFRERYPEELVLFYVNHLGCETGTLERPFLGADGETRDAAAD